MTLIGRLFLGIWISLVAVCGTASAALFQPVLDEFWILKNSTEIFRDSFNSGGPPPSGPDDGLYNPTTYFVFGPAGITSETGSKLTLTPSLGDPTIITTTYADLATDAVRLLATNPANPNFLGQDSSFEIHALYDMSSLPTITGQSFGVRANDRATALGNEGNNMFNLFVGVSAITGDVSVFLRLNDFSTDTSVVLWSDSIQSWLTGADQIELILSKEAGSNQISALYTLYDYDLASPILRSGSRLNAGSIYIGEDYIRAQIGASDRILSVPEPATLALLGLGLLGLGFSRRKH